GGVVELAQQAGDLDDPLVGPRIGMDELAVHVRQDLAAGVVHTVAEEPGRAPEPDRFQMTKEGVHGGRPRAGRPVDAVADTEDESIVVERDGVGWRDEGRVEAGAWIDRRQPER